MPHGQISLRVPGQHLPFVRPGQVLLSQLPQFPLLLITKKFKPVLKVRRVFLRRLDKEHPQVLTRLVVAHLVAKVKVARRDGSAEVDQVVGLILPALGPVVRVEVCKLGRRRSCYLGGWLGS